MTKRDYRLFIEDILESMSMIGEYIEDMDYHHFLVDRKTIDAVIRNLEIIGEAARNIPEEIRNVYPAVPWKKMIGLRNIAIHAYFGIDLEIVWRIVSTNIPDAKTEITKLLDSFHDL